MSTADQMSVEERVRTATRAGASLIRDVRPLGAPAPVRLRHRPERPPRRWVNWGVPLAAAAAVAVIALILVGVRVAGTPSPGTSPSAATTAPANVPRYYAAVVPGATENTYGPLIVGDDLTGTVIDTVSPPPGLVFASVHGTSDDRTFVVLTAARTPRVAGPPPYTWYLLRIAPGSAHPYQLTKIPIRLPGNDPGALAYALSPDGREVAVESEPGSVSTRNVIRLGIYSLSTGAELRAWTTTDVKITSAVSDITLSWASGGQQLAFSAVQFTPGSGDNLQLRTLDVTGAGTDLMAASRVLLSTGNTGASTCYSLQLTPDDGTAVCGTQDALWTGTGSDTGCANGRLELTAYSVRTGRLARVLYQYRGACHNGVSYLLWTDASASSLIEETMINVGNAGGKQAVQIGAITGGHLRPLKIAKSVFPAAANPMVYVSLAF